MPYLRLIFLLLAFSASSNAASNVCPIAKDLKAEEAINKAHDWDSLYRVYRQFKNCDDGGTAESFDDAVIKMLANSWIATPHLVVLMARDKHFSRFVISHISATGDLNELKKIQESASKNCSSGNKNTCDLIEARAINAIKTLESAF